MSEIVRLAIPSKGRLHERTIQLLRRANIVVNVTGRSLASRTADARIQVIFVRPFPPWAGQNPLNSLLFL